MLLITCCLIQSLNCMGQNLHLDARFCLIITHAFLSDWSDYDPYAGASGYAYQKLCNSHCPKYTFSVNWHTEVVFG